MRDGGNREAREKMLLGAMLAGQAFANAPVAAVHALAYPVGARFHVPHGLSNSLVLPEVIKFNAPAAQDPGEGLIGDTVFLDRNGNGAFDAGEGLEGVTVRLYSASGSLLCASPSVCPISCAATVSRSTLRVSLSTQRSSSSKCRNTWFSS